MIYILKLCLRTVCIVQDVIWICRKLSQTDWETYLNISAVGQDYVVQCVRKVAVHLYKVLEVN
jgi:hypothetical protein